MDNGITSRAVRASVMVVALYAAMGVAFPKTGWSRSIRELTKNGDAIMIHRDRLTANLEGGFAVFLIGMRINRPLLIHKWWPVAVAMPRMLKELYRQPELGFLHAEMWFSRTIILLQYWRSTEHLMAYAKSKEMAHLPAWQAFNRAIGVDGSVGIWHETYKVAPGGYENVYVNMPPFGLGRAGKLQEAKGDLKSAIDRLRANVK